MSEQEKNLVKKIMGQYTEKEVSKVEQLRKLDNKAKKPAYIFAYTFGTISSLILGFGMSIAMEVILPNLLPLGIVIGCLGLVMALINYPIYKKLLKNSTAKYAKEIIELSNEIIND